MTKTPNYLGSTLEKQKHFKLPYQQTLNELTQLTAMVKQSLQAVLPSEATDPLLVIHATSQSLVISTPNHTVANHLNYMSQSILSLLHHDHPRLRNVTQLKFRVVMLQHRFTQADLPPNSQPRHAPFRIANAQGLSERTRKDIAQLATLITDNPRLKAILEKLAANKPT